LDSQPRLVVINAAHLALRALIDKMKRSHVA